MIGNVDKIVYCNILVILVYWNMFMLMSVTKINDMPCITYIV